MNSLLQDLRYGARMLLKKPGFTLIAVFTLALGIGANTAIFSLVNALLLRPLPYKQPEQLVRVTSDLVKRNATDVGVDVPLLDDLSERAGVFTEVCGIYPVNANLTGGNEPERIEGVMVSANYFALLGVEAARGRVFGATDYRPGNAEVVVISDSLWRRRFGGDSNIVGKTVRLDNDLYTILGVMPPGFRHPGQGLQGEVELWQPSGFRATPFQAPARGIYVISGALARLKPGVTSESAQRQLSALAENLRRENPKEYPDHLGWSPRLIPLQKDLVGKTRTALFILLGAVGFVLLIACANVANLLLSRATARHRELAIRAALGASRSRLIRQFLTESLLLSFIGAALGLLLTVWTMDALTRLLPADIPRVVEISVDARVLVFTFAMSLLTCLIFCLAPSISATKAQAEALKDASRGMTAGAPGNRLRNLLVISEFALALVLLIGAGLLTRSFGRLLNAPPGFNPERVLTARLWMPLPNDPQTSPYFQHERRLAFFRSALERISRLSGVEAVGWSNRFPLDGSRGGQPFWIEGRPIETAQISVAEPFHVSPGYFQALQIPLVKGRYFNDHDDERAPGVLLISESLAARFFPDDDALGKRIRPGGADSTAPWLEIVGIVRDVKSAGLDATYSPQMYRCLWQRSRLESALVVRGAFDPASLKETLRREIRKVDPDLPVFGVRTMSEVMAASVSQKRFAMLLLGLFAMVALLLAAVGIYGVMAYLVEQRTHEIGIRLALGAEARDILCLVLGRGLALTLWGGAIGLLGALALTRFLSSLLFDLSATDPITYLGVMLLLAGVALMACWIPARRATKVDPMIALRCE